VGPVALSQALASATRSTARRCISMLAPLLACSAVERAISHHFTIDFHSEPMSRKAHEFPHHLVVRPNLEHSVVMTESTDPVRAALSIPVHVDTLMQLDGRVAAVTGTSSGLGQRFARVLDAAGASVILASRGTTPTSNWLQRCKTRWPSAVTCARLPTARRWPPPPSSASAGSTSCSTTPASPIPNQPRRSRRSAYANCSRPTWSASTH
jgi:hypothetical protein